MGVSSAGSEAARSKAAESLKTIEKPLADNFLTESNPTEQNLLVEQPKMADAQTP